VAGRADRPPVLALTGGDPNGIGPEICLRAALSRKVRAACRPVLVGDPAVFEYYRRTLRIPATLTEGIPPGAPARGTAVGVIAVRPVRGFRPNPGKPSKSAGLIAGRSLEQAVGLCLGGIADAVVTGPLAKSTLNLAGFNFPGQTELVARRSSSGPPLMILMNGEFRVALATAHLPLRKVPRALTVGGITRAITILHDSLVTDFRIRRPSIAVLALNPHAGECGLLGSEEEEVIGPAIRAAARRGITVTGPHPADGFFGMRSHESFDGVVAMYHDQGLIPLKLTGFSSGVNFSAGLSVVRTSPGHGTAYDLAGTGRADPSSMIGAVMAAVAISRSRRMRAGRRGGR